MMQSVTRAFHVFELEACRRTRCPSTLLEFFLALIINDSMAQQNVSQPQSNHRILLMLDVQEGMLDALNGVPSASVVRANISKILRYARNAAPPPFIIHVRNNGDFSESDEPGTKGWELINKPLPNEPVIDKFSEDLISG
jgi:Isochorismatase family